MGQTADGRTATGSTRCIGGGGVEGGAYRGGEGCEVCPFLIVRSDNTAGLGTCNVCNVMTLFGNGVIARRAGEGGLSFLLV